MNLFVKLIEPKNSVEENRKLFTNTDLRKLIIPLVIEQMLLMMVGFVDTLMISYAGEASVSGVSMVDMINNFFIFIFTALATGGAVVVSQYLGNKDKDGTCEAASQLVMITTLFSLLLTAVALLFHGSLLYLMFGTVEKNVMTAGDTYFVISSFSLPFLGIYNACAALFRSMSQSKVTMNISLGMNVLHVIGNAIGIFAFHAGVAGVAIPTVISRAVAALVIFVLILNKNNPVSVNIKDIFKWKNKHIRNILNIAVPNGIENGLFQLSKIVLVSIIAMFGTAQIAANGVANSIDYIAGIIVTGMSLAIVTVVGQCVGANEYAQADYYIKKLLRISYVASAILALTIVAFMPLILKLYSLSTETCQYVFILVVLHNLFLITVFPLSGPLSNAMRAAGDVRYTMAVSIFATVICRVIFSIILGVWLHMGVVGMWLAMGIDWTIRAFLFVLRYRSEKWKNFRVI